MCVTNAAIIPLTSSTAYSNMATQFIIIAILTLINAFFASAEMAMVSINKNKMKVIADEGNKEATLIMKLLNEPSRFLATIQVGITLAGFFSSAFAATGLSGDLAIVLKSIGLPYAEQIALVGITIALSFVMLLFGELFPKRLALQKAEAIALFSVTPIYWLSVMAKPFVKLLSTCTNGLLHLVGINQKNLDQKVSEEEIRSMVKVGQELGVINQIEKQMINSIFEFDDKLAREIMTPRLDMHMVDLAQPIDAVIKDLVQLKYSRIPVYDGNKDLVVGIIHMKSLLVAFLEQGVDTINLDTIMQNPFFVPETISIDRLFVKMQKEQRHMAILVDEHGMASGLITMEDLIEEVMGDIEDEFDSSTSDFERIDQNSYRLLASVALFEFNELFHTSIESEISDTIGGYMINELNALPPYKDDKEVFVDNWKLVVDKTDGPRIETIIVYRLD